MYMYMHIHVSIIYIYMYMYIYSMYIYIDADNIKIFRLLPTLILFPYKYINKKTFKVA